MSRFFCFSARRGHDSFANSPELTMRTYFLYTFVGGLIQFYSKLAKKRKMTIFFFLNEKRKGSIGFDSDVVHCGAKLFFFFQAYYLFPLPPPTVLCCMCLFYCFDLLPNNWHGTFLHILHATRSINVKYLPLSLYTKFLDKPHPHLGNYGVEHYATYFKYAAYHPPYIKHLILMEK